jgi:hypothetical protein
MKTQTELRCSDGEYECLDIFNPLFNADGDSQDVLFSLASAAASESSLQMLGDKQQTP